MTVLANKRSRQTPQADTEPIRASCYARYSSSKQNARSCDDQVERIQYLIGKGDVNSRMFPGRQIKIIPEWIVKDAAISGRSASREGYQVITDALSSNACPFDVIIVDDLTRLNRDLGNSLQFYQLAQYAGVEILSVSDSLSSADPNARSLFTVKGLVGDMSNEAHSMRTLRGMEMKALQGFSCGDICYGYRSEHTRVAREGARDVPRDYKILINEQEAQVVRKIYRLFVEGHGRAAICRILNQEKVPWPGFRATPPRGTGWSPTSIHTILTSPKYIGIWLWKQTRYVVNPQTGQKICKPRPQKDWMSHHEGQKHREDLRIISQSLWNKAQSVFEAIHEKHDTHGNWGRYRSSVPLHMLSGILKCGVCGGAMIISSGSKGGYYGCYANRQKQTCQQQRLIRRVRLEKVVINFISSQIQDDSIFQEAAQRYNRLMNEKLSRGRENLVQFEQELARTEMELHHLAEAVMRGDSETLTKAIQNKETRRRYLIHQLHQIKASSQDKVFVTPPAIKERFKKLLDTMQKQPVTASKALKSLFSDGLQMKWDGKNWKITGSMAVGSPGLQKEVSIVI